MNKKYIGISVKGPIEGRKVLKELQEKGFKPYTPTNSWCNFDRVKSICVNNNGKILYNTDEIRGKKIIMCNSIRDMITEFVAYSFVNMNFYKKICKETLVAITLTAIWLSPIYFAILFLIKKEFAALSSTMLYSIWIVIALIEVNNQEEYRIHGVDHKNFFRDVFIAIPHFMLFCIPPALTVYAFYIGAHNFSIFGVCFCALEIYSIVYIKNDLYEKTMIPGHRIPVWTKVKDDKFNK